MACLLTGVWMLCARVSHNLSRVDAKRANMVRPNAVRRRFGRPDRGRQAAQPRSIIRGMQCHHGASPQAPATDPHLARARCSGAGGGASRRPARTATPRSARSLSVLLFLAAIISAFWYLRNEEFEREQEAVKRDTEVAQQQIRLRLIENQEQLVRIAREIVTGTIDRNDFLGQAAGFTRSARRSPT